MKHRDENMCILFSLFDQLASSAGFSFKGNVQGKGRCEETPWEWGIPLKEKRSKLEGRRGAVTEQ